MPMRQLRIVWPMGCPSVRSRAQDRAESTSDRLTRAAIVKASFGCARHGVYRSGPGIPLVALIAPVAAIPLGHEYNLSLIHISEPTRQAEISYAVFCLKKKKKKKRQTRIQLH